MCIAYELDGKKIDYLPAAVDDQLKVKPIYKTFKETAKYFILLECFFLK